MKENKNKTDRNKASREVPYKTEGLKYFHFDMSETNHEIVLPSEKESTWENLQEITWDPGRGD